MASRLKRKQGALVVSGSESHGLPGGMFSLYTPESSTRDARKKRKDKQSWVNHTLTPYFDGHLWRKYGQKTIKDAPYPRLYFRCSYREDRHCMASKLVQQVNNQDPPLFEVTYMYKHTCNAEPVLAPDYIAPARAPAASDGLVLSFGSSSGSSPQCPGATQKQKERTGQQEYFQRQSVPPSMMANFDSLKSQQTMPACFSPPDSHLTPRLTAVSSWSSPFPTIESASSSTSNTEDDLLSSWDWNSLNDWIDRLDDDAKFPGTTFSLETDGLSLAQELKELIL